jgi:hypothetical protein
VPDNAKVDDALALDRSLAVPVRVRPMLAVALADEVLDATPDKAIIDEAEALDRELTAPLVANARLPTALEVAGAVAVSAVATVSVA